jgi:hypothetical protein
MILPQRYTRVKLGRRPLDVNGVAVGIDTAVIVRVNLKGRCLRRFNEEAAPFGFEDRGPQVLARTATSEIRTLAGERNDLPVKIDFYLVISRALHFAVEVAGAAFIQPDRSRQEQAPPFALRIGVKFRVEPLG